MGVFVACPLLSPAVQVHLLLDTPQACGMFCYLAFVLLLLCDLDLISTLILMRVVVLLLRPEFRPHMSLRLDLRAEFGVNKTRCFLLSHVEIYVASMARFPSCKRPINISHLCVLQCGLLLSGKLFLIFPLVTELNRSGVCMTNLWTLPYTRVLELFLHKPESIMRCIGVPVLGRLQHIHQVWAVVRKGGVQK